MNCPRLNVHGTGLDDKGLPVIPTDVVSPAMWLTAARTLTRLAELGERAGPGVHAGEPEHRRRPSAHPVRQGRGHPGAGRGRRQSLPANESRPLPRTDRRGEPDPTGRTGAARASARSRSRTSPVAANPAPARSTTRRSPPRSTGSATTASSRLEAFASGDSVAGARPLPPCVRRSRDAVSAAKLAFNASCPRHRARTRLVSSTPRSGVRRGRPRIRAPRPASTCPSPPASPAVPARAPRR